ncbi:MAG: hypothetical protein HFACDABA_02236 [Anaerolineales bacterium]|nr:hypothetical protein [Anaerolineales bacterium]
MPRKHFFILVLTILLVTACGGQTTTATEPQFKPISMMAATTADAELYAALAELDPDPADRIALAVAIEGLDPASLPSAPSGPLQTHAVGDTHEFWTHNSDEFTFTRITAKLMFISKHAYFWQDEDSQPFNADGEIATDKDWAAVGESFDTSYERVRAVFGTEEAPGLDGDARLFVIYSDALGKVGGYFGQADQLPAAVEAHSNQGQFFFISNTWSSGVAGEYNKEVLAHEFQHMVHKHMDPNEEGWMNEGLSMLAQQVAGMRGYNSVADYLAKPDQSLWFWGSDGQDYGQAFLFMAYLYEQMGEDFISALVANQVNGLASIDETLTQFNSPRSADDMYADALTAAFFNNASLSDGQFVYRIPVIPQIAPRYEFTSDSGIYQGIVQQYGGVDIMSFTGRKQAILTFTGDPTIQLIPTEAHSGGNFWWSNRYDSSFSALTRAVDLSHVSSATLNYWAWYDIEEDWDYAYLLVSTDNGGRWDLVPATSSRETDPNDQNLGHGFSGKSGGGADAAWIQESADLSAYAGQKILLRFAMQNDLAVNNFGFAVDDLSIPEIQWSDDVESGGAGWTPGGFILSHNRVPQTWRVRAVEERRDGSIVIHDIEVVNGTGNLSIDFSNLKRLVVFVIGQTRYTTLPAAYQVEVAPGK